MRANPKLPGERHFARDQPAARKAGTANPDPLAHPVLRAGITVVMHGATENNAITALSSAPRQARLTDAIRKISEFQIASYHLVSPMSCRSA